MRVLYILEQYNIFLQETETKDFHCRYAMDVNPERAEDVLGHKRLLELARTNKTAPPIVHVRSIHVSISPFSPLDMFKMVL